MNIFIFYPRKNLIESLENRKGNYSLPRILVHIAQMQDYHVTVLSKDEEPASYFNIQIVPLSLSNLLKAIRNRNMSKKTVIISQLYRMFPIAVLCKILTCSPLLVRTGGVFLGREDILRPSLFIKKLHYWFFYKLSDHVLSTADGTPVDLYMKRMGVKSYSKMLNGFPVFRNVINIKRKNIILCISRLSAEKNINYVIDTFSQALPKLNEPYSLVIIGDGPERKNLESLVKRLRIENMVIFKGKQSNVAEYLYESKLQLTGVANNTIIEGIVTDTPTIGVELGESSILYKSFDNIRIIPYKHGGCGPFPEDEYDSIVHNTVVEIVRILNNYESFHSKQSVDIQQYGWKQRIERELKLYQRLTANLHEC